jgi:tRNA (cytidine/uridine-2'-O-)-methyltransferase
MRTELGNPRARSSAPLFGRGYFASFFVVVYRLAGANSAGLKTAAAKARPAARQLSTARRKFAAARLRAGCDLRARGHDKRAESCLGTKSMTTPSAPLTLALYEPDIAQNAGAMLRTCACLGVDAAIIEPAGFAISDRRLRRSGMDYLDALIIERHLSFEHFEAWRARAGRRLVLLTTKGEAALWDFAFRPGDVILVGRESAGVPAEVRARADARVKIPIRPPLRSLNVGVAAALALGEARRQLRGEPGPIRAVAGAAGDQGAARA